jgi:hypothetical protein
MFQNAQIAGPCLDPSKYHGWNEAHKLERGDPKFVASSSMLREFLHCASRWKNGYVPPDSEAKKTGSLLDCVLLVPDQFKTRYIIRTETYPVMDKHGEETGEQKPWSGNATWCREFVKEATEAGLEVVSKADVLEADAARKRIMADEILAAWFNSCDRQIWVTAEWVDKATGLILPVQVLLDFVPRADTEFAKCLGDFKAVASGGLRAFKSQVFKYGWHIQAALYTDVYMAAVNPKNDPDGEDRNTWCFAGVENYPPFEPFRRLLLSEFVMEGRRMYQHAFKSYARALTTGAWMNYDDNPEAIQGWTPIAMESWMAYEALSEKLEDDAAEALQENDDIVP